MHRSTRSVPRLVSRRSPRRRSGGALSHALIVLLIGAPAAAQSTRATIALELTGEWRPELADALRADLGASLGERGLRLVDASLEPEEAVAVVRMSAPTREQRGVLIAVDDRLNTKHLERFVDLSSDPADTWSALLAASADELLRAAWLELLIADAPPVRRDPPPEIRRVVEAIVEPPAPPHRPVSLDLDAAIEGYTGGAIVLGGDARGAFFFVPRFGLELALGARGMLPAQSRLGEVSAAILATEIDARGVIVPGDYRFEVIAGVRALLVLWTPIPDRGAEPIGSAQGVVVLRGGVSASLAPDPAWQLGVSATVGAVLLGTVASDDQDPIVGVSGVELGLRAEVATWP
jgi:hypothetical protein